MDRTGCILLLASLLTLDICHATGCIGKYCGGGGGGGRKGGGGGGGGGSKYTHSHGLIIKKLTKTLQEEF